MAKKALVLLNMGGPNNLDEVELFLKNMFADKNILPLILPLRKLVATMIIKSRLEEAKENYRQIGAKSPLPKLTQNLVQKLQKALGDAVKVTAIMRYTPPFANEVLKQLQDEGIEQLYLFPMYPQYSTTTTKSSVEDVYESAKKLGYDPKFFTVESYFADNLYTDAVAKQIQKKLDAHPNYDVIFSAHGLPQSIIKKGDPYEKHIQKTVELVSQKLQNANKIHLAYQSKVGNGKWLEPSLEECLKTIENKKVIIYPIAFTIDNSETVFELKIEYKEIAQELGIEDYVVCNCLNANEDFVKLICEIYQRM
jgi:ferrochelatase